MIRPDGILKEHFLFFHMLIDDLMINRFMAEIVEVCMIDQLFPARCFYSAGLFHRD